MDIGKPSPPCSDSGGYSVQPPAGEPPGTNSVASSSVKANGRIQKLKLFRRGSAMSGAPTCIGIIQFARPVQAGMTAPKIMISACMVVMRVEELRIDQLQAGLEQFGADDHRHRAADEEHHAGEDQVHRADVLVIRREDPAAPAVGGAVVVVVMSRRGRGQQWFRVPCLTSRLNLVCGMAALTARPWSRRRPTRRWPGPSRARRRPSAPPAWRAARRRTRPATSLPPRWA